ncbi:PAS domain S-box protein [Patescibacteria group bacterium]|nr:PAS domain S-box protein [Patescibacteria group bacterium]MBU1673511.1 PAS domain S-box protein [Patescibacteria group bacterium]
MDKALQKPLEEIKKCKQDLKQSNLYFDIAEVMLVLLDNEGKVARINKKGAKILGYPEKEIIGKNWFTNFLPARMKKDVRDVFNELMAGQIKDVEYFENPIINKKGEERLLSFHNIYIKNEKGKIINTLSSGQDITEQKKGESVLKESEKKFKIIFDSAPDAMFIIDLKGNFIDANKMVEQISGYSKKVMAGQNLFRTRMLGRADLKKAAKSLAHNLRGLPSGPEEYTLLQRGGKKIKVEIKSFPIKLKGKRCILGIARDISERKKMKQGLIESEKKYKNLSENILDSVIIIDFKGKILFGNKAAAKMFGFKDIKEALGMNISIFLTEGMKKLVLREIFDVIKGKGNYLSEYKVKDIKGKQFWIESWGTLINYEGQRAIIASLRNVTDRKQAEERLKMAADVSIDLIYEWDVKNDNLEWFGPIDEVLGYKPGEISHTIKAWIDLMHPDDRTRLIDSVKLHRQSQRPIFEEYRVRKKDGSYAYWEDRGKPVLDEHSRPVKWIGSCTDITQRKQAEEQIKKSEEKYRTIFENSKDGILYSGRNGKIITINPQLEKIVGYKKEEVAGKSFLKLRHIILPENIPYLAKLFKEGLVKGKSTPELDLKIRCKNGQIKYIHISASQELENNKVVGFVNIIRDITEKRIAEKALQEKMDELERTNKAMVGREIKMIELKNKIKDLESRLANRG